MLFDKSTILFVNNKSANKIRIMVTVLLHITTFHKHISREIYYPN